MHTTVSKSVFYSRGGQGEVPGGAESRVDHSSPSLSSLVDTSTFNSALLTIKGFWMLQSSFEQSVCNLDTLCVDGELKANAHTLT